MEQSNLSNVKGVGSGVFECRMDFGPGYRICFGKDGDTLIILLGGGIKRRQQQDPARGCFASSGLQAPRKTGDRRSRNASTASSKSSVSSVSMTSSVSM